MSQQLEFEDLQKIISSHAAALRLRAKLQPAGGASDKVFPPTYDGATYATEKRRLSGRDEPVDCVLLDSVQSQANRMEEALQLAADDRRIQLPIIEVDFTDYFPGDDQPKDMRLLDPVGKISSLQAPHRIADAILRDSLLDGTPFRQSDVGKRLNRVSVRNATTLFELCPTALLFGMWDSTGPKGGLGAKFERAIVSEIIGIGAVLGLKTSSRIDPLGIQRNAGPLYATKEGGWTLNPSEAKQEKNKPVLLGKEGRPSEANHGNIVPSLSGTDREGQYLAGGITIEFAEQTMVISLPAIRRLTFPVKGNRSPNVDQAAQTVLVALGLVAASLADEAGLDLRSRCLLYSEDDLKWELAGRQTGDEYTLKTDQAISNYEQAVESAKAAGLPWLEEPLVLQPSKQLIQLVVRSQELTAKQGAEAGVE